ncbi:unnamed protein product [Brassica napus]|uniref:non-specific serine/threonine protein kinase n=1 Tax=Brassica napus TaxID=3708 RepID=A0A816L451_BRANA|nr:unnamed protein product [Brassica napus]
MILVVVIELRFYSSNSQNLTCHPRELEALRDFINELDSKPDGWDFNSTGDCCEWEGITCSSSLHLNDPDKKTLRITKVQAEACEQKDCPLRVLNLSRNFIFGSIPRSIFNLANLETLDLSSNELTGQVRLIRLESNSFSGDIPYGFEKCAELTGNIPEDLFQLQRLNLLEIQEKGLSGSLGPALGNLSSLVHLDISSNRFSGEIPDVFDTLHDLILLNLGNNSLSGPLYLNCAVMTNLASLDLGTNKFNSSFPEYLPFKDFIDASHPSALQEPDNSDSHFEFPWRDVA